MIRAIASALQQVRLGSVALLSESRRPSLIGPRALLATQAAASVSLAVPVACAMNLPDVWWAAISAVMASTPGRHAGLLKGLRRIVGTMAGAAAALVMSSWLAYDEVACCLALFVVSSLGIYGMAVSSHGYAWLFFAITFVLVIMLSLDDPAQAFTYAACRTLEVVVGTLASVMVGLLLAEEDSATPEAPAGWRDPFGARWSVVRYAVQSGIAVAVLPIIWSAFDLPGVTTMAITVAALMAVPTAVDQVLDDHARLVAKAAYRLLGCGLGGCLALIVVVIAPANLAVWLGALCAGVWLFIWMQGSPSGAGYIGTQACIAYLVTVVQGEGPPESIMPGINRFAGITLGIAALLIVTATVRSFWTGDQTHPARA
jgi:uncharacterized membrane protein YccC